MDNYIFETEHLQLERKDRSDNYILTIYDRYGHFLDTLHLDKEDIEEIYHSLDEQKDVLGLK